MIKLTFTISPFLVAIIVGCQSTPWSIVVSSCTTVITTSFVDERECTAVVICDPSSTFTYKNKFLLSYEDNYPIYKNGLIQWYSFFLNLPETK